MIQGSIPQETLRRWVRLLLLLEGSERAGIAPIHVKRLHIYAYLSNVLAPVWSSHTFDGTVLKRRSGPFYPALQRDLDRLVGLGIVLISHLDHVVDQDGDYRLDGYFSLNRDLAEAPLGAIREFPHHVETQSYLLELAQAVSALSEEEFDSVPQEDATYADSNVGFANVVDFARWRKINFSANAAAHFAVFYEQATPSELIHLYVRHLHRRLGGER